MTANRAKVIRSDPKFFSLNFFSGDFFELYHATSPSNHHFQGEYFLGTTFPSIEGRNMQIHSLIFPCSHETNRCFGSSYVHRASCSSNTDRFPWRRGPRKRTARGFPGDGWKGLGGVEGWSESYAEKRRVFVGEKIGNRIQYYEL